MNAALTHTQLVSMTGLFNGLHELGRLRVHERDALLEAVAAIRQADEAVPEVEEACRILQLRGSLREGITRAVDDIVSPAGTAR